MKISIDDKELFTLTDIQKRVIQNDIPREIFDEDMKRRLKYILTHKYEECFKRLKNDWQNKLELRGIKIPSDPEELATLIFNQSDYQDRSTRDAGNIVL